MFDKKEQVIPVSSANNTILIVIIAIMALVI